MCGRTALRCERQSTAPGGHGSETEQTRKENLHALLIIYVFPDTIECFSVRRPGILEPPRESHGVARSHDRTGRTAFPLPDPSRAPPALELLGEATRPHAVQSNSLKNPLVVCLRCGIRPRRLRCYCIGSGCHQTHTHLHKYATHREDWFVLIGCGPAAGLIDGLPLRRGRHDSRRGSDHARGVCVVLLAVLRCGFLHRQSDVPVIICTATPDRSGCLSSSSSSTPSSLRSSSAYPF